MSSERFIIHDGLWAEREEDMGSVLFEDARIAPSLARDRCTGALLVAKGEVSWVGGTDEVGSRVDRVVDCDGATLLPGFHDAHLHFLAYASSLRQVDCGPEAAASIADVRRLLAERLRATPAGRWVRGRGYDDLSMTERRYPNRYDLDAASPEHPVRLDHRSGHACVLNSTGLALVGIGPNTPDPPEGVIERDEHGVPTGVLYEMNAYLSERMEDTHDRTDMREAVARASRNLLRWGVTSFEDATPENHVARWETFRRYQADGLIKQRVTLMPGIHHVEAFVREGLGYGEADKGQTRGGRHAGGRRRGLPPSTSSGQRLRGMGGLRLGHAKIVVTLTTGGLYPPEETLREMVGDAHQLGFPVAVHAVEEEAILAVVDALHRCHSAGRSYAGQGGAEARRTDGSPGEILRRGVYPERSEWAPQNDRRDRVEHCSEATPAVLTALKGTGVAVCTNPAFVYESGPRYRATVPPGVLPWLYPVRSLLETGVPLAAGSDAPVASPDPKRGLYAAMTRRDVRGEALHAEQGVSLEQALGMYAGMGQSGIRAFGRSGTKVGKQADLVLLDRDVTQARPEELLAVRAALVMVDGEVVWEGIGPPNHV